MRGNGRLGKEVKTEDVHSWFTLQLPSLLTVATGRQGVPHELDPGSIGLPFPSRARFHIRPLWELCSMEPMKLCRTSRTRHERRNQTQSQMHRIAATDSQVIHVPL